MSCRAGIVTLLAGILLSACGSQPSDNSDLEAETKAEVSSSGTSEQKRRRSTSPGQSRGDQSIASSATQGAGEKKPSINRYANIKLPKSLDKLSPKDKKLKARQFFQLSQDYREKHDYENMVESASIAILLDPNMAEAYLARARALHHSAYGDDSLALKDVERAAELNPNLHEVHEYLGRLYDSQKKYELAVKAYERAIKLNPGDRDSRSMRAGDLRLLGRNIEAIDCYGDIIKNFPTKSDAYIQRGSLYEYLGQNKRALIDYSNACSLKENHTGMGAAQVFRARAKLYAKLGDTEKAIEDFTDVLERDPYDEEALRARALQYEKLERYDQALADLNKSIELSPEYGRAAYESRARLYNRIGKEKLAEADLKKARSIKERPAEIPIYSIKRAKK